MLNLIEIIKTIILGIIEGVTEWLPISSTGSFNFSERDYSIRRFC